MTLFRAIFITVFLLASILYGLKVCIPIFPSGQGEEQRYGSDIDYYQTVVEQINAGNSYYTVAGHELRRWGYPTRSIFNWRLPLLAWLLGQLPSIRAGQVLAFILAIITIIIWLSVFYKYKYAFWQSLLGGLFLLGPVIYTIFLRNFTFYHEFWAGTLIALSLAAHARGWRNTCVFAGLMALFLRELSLPFVFIMMILAYKDGEHREASMWFIGLLIFGAEFLLHWSIVSQLITENDRALQSGWIVFGGWPFVLNTVQMHPFLVLSPSWAAAIIVPFALLGLSGWQGATGTRIAYTVGIYMVAFSVAGRSVNVYWGFMYAFIMPLGLLHTPHVLRELLAVISNRTAGKYKHRR